MKTKYIISIILNVLAIILFTYLSLYEFDHKGWKTVTLLFIMLVIVSVYSFFRLYLIYIDKPANSSNSHPKKEVR